MNGLPAIKYMDVVFVPLPREQWRAIDGGCGCRWCSAVARESAPAFWDTLVVPRKGGRTSVCHAPEYHGVEVKR